MKRKSYGNNLDENGAILEHRRNEEILEEARVGQIAIVMRRRRLESCEHVTRRDETEHTRAVVEMKKEGSALEEDPRCNGNTLSEGT